MDNAHSHGVGAGTPKRKFCGDGAGHVKPRAPWAGRPQTDGEQGPVSLWADCGKDWDQQDRENPGAWAWQRVAEVREDLRGRGRGRETPHPPRTSDQYQPRTPPGPAPTPHPPRTNDHHQPHTPPGPATSIRSEAPGRGRKSSTRPGFPQKTRWTRRCSPRGQDTPLSWKQDTCDGRTLTQA